MDMEVFFAALAAFSWPKRVKIVQNHAKPVDFEVDSAPKRRRAANHQPHQGIQGPMDEPCERRIGQPPF